MECGRRTGGHRVGERVGAAVSCSGVCLTTVPRETWGHRVLSSCHVRTRRNVITSCHDRASRQGICYRGGPRQKAKPAPLVRRRHQGEAAQHVRTRHQSNAYAAAQKIGCMVGHCPSSAQDMSVRGTKSGRNQTRHHLGTTCHPTPTSALATSCRQICTHHHATTFPHAPTP